MALEGRGSSSQQGSLKILCLHLGSYRGRTPDKHLGMVVDLGWIPDLIRTEGGEEPGRKD